MKFSVLLAAVAVLSVTLFPNSVVAQASARFSYDAVVNCTNPNVQNYPVHYEGTGQLSTNKSASLELQSNISGRESYNVRLGGPAVSANGGSASLRVAGSKTLRAVRDYPNNILVVNLTVRGTSCSIAVDNRLKAGKRQYTFTTQMGLAYCDRPRVVKTSCNAI